MDGPSIVSTDCVLLSAGVPVGLACVGLGKAISGAGARPSVMIALATSITLLLTAMACLLPVPVGKVAVEDLHYDKGHLTDRVLAFMHGALAFTSIMHLAPAALQSKARRGKVGVLIGVAVAVACWLVHGFMCLSTPYCLAMAHMK